MLGETCFPLEEEFIIENWAVNETDKRIISDIEKSLPSKIFDCHAHLYRIDDLNLNGLHPWLAEGPLQTGVTAWRDHIGGLVGKDRLAGGLFIPFPTPEVDMAKCNKFVLQEAATGQNSRALALVSPSMSPDSVQHNLEDPLLAGFKPYHIYSSEKPTSQAPISSYLPNWALEIANDHQLIVLLHIVRVRALADPVNQREIKEMCESYPGVRFILAHAARGFHSMHTIEGLKALRTCENIWFDTAAICEPAALFACLKEFGPRKLLFGTDFPVSHIRGKAVTVGEGFFWLQNDTVAMDNLAATVPYEPSLVALDQYRFSARVSQQIKNREREIKKAEILSRQ